MGSNLLRETVRAGEGQHVFVHSMERVCACYLPDTVLGAYKSEPNSLLCIFGRKQEINLKGSYIRRCWVPW